MRLLRRICDPLLFLRIAPKFYNHTVSGCFKVARALTYVCGKKQWPHALMKVTRTATRIESRFYDEAPSACGKTSCSDVVCRIGT